MITKPIEWPKPSVPQELPEIMTAQEVAKFLRCDARTVTTRAKRGEIPGRQIGSLWRFNRKKIMELV